MALEAAHDGLVEEGVVMTHGGHHLLAVFLLRGVCIEGRGLGEEEEEEEEGREAATEDAAAKVAI